MGKKKEPEIRFIVLDVSDSSELLQIANEELAYALNEIHNLRAVNDYRAMIINDLRVSRSNLFRKNNELMDEIQMLRLEVAKHKEEVNKLTYDAFDAADDSIATEEELQELRNKLMGD